MAYVILDLSKYLIIIFAIVFTVAAYYSIPVENSDKKWIAVVRSVCIFGLQLAGNLALALNKADGSVFAFYFLQLGLIVAFRIGYLKLHSKTSVLLIDIFCMLLTFGFITLARLNIELAYRQFVMVLIGMALSLAVPYGVEYIKGDNIVSIICAAVGIVALGLVFVLGDTERGAKLAISIGFLSFQASEIVKITFVIMCAGLFRDGEDRNNIIMGTGFAIVHILILVLSRDLGAALIFGVAYLILLYVATERLAVLMAGGAGVAVFGLIAYHVFSHVQTRVDIWINPWKDILGDGWQICQSLFAIGTGGWSGSGLYNGMPNSIPIVTKDFVFAAISEEMGGITGVCIMLIYMVLIIKIIKTAIGSRSEYVKLLFTGIACIIAVQTILNIGGVIKFIPMTGVTLPLISYGGSSIVSMFVIFGLIEGFSNIKLRKL